MTSGAHDFPAEPSWMSAVLGFMEELARVAASDSDFDATLSWIVQRLKRQFGCDEMCVRLRDPGSRNPKGHTAHWRRERCSGPWPGEVSVSVMAYVTDGAKTLVTPDVIEDQRFPELRRVRSRVRAAMVAPIVVEDKIVGVLAATESEPGRNWTRDEQWAFQAIAARSGSALEAVQLRDLRRKCDRLEEINERWCRENHYAAQLQRSVIPARPLSLADWTVAGQVKSASVVGGDGFDARRAGDTRICFSVSDVMGKGLRAAILMVAVQALLREVCTGERCIKEAMTHLDRDLTGVHRGSMVTLFYGELETSNGRLRYHRAGHPCPFLRRRDGSIDELTVGSHPLGLGLDGERDIGETQIEPGEELLLFSDGITDAQNSAGEFFGEDRVRQILGRARPGHPERLVGGVLRAARTFAGRGAQQDDMTVAVLESPAPRQPRQFSGGRGIHGRSGRGPGVWSDSGDCAGSGT